MLPGPLGCERQRLDGHGYGAAEPKAHVLLPERSLRRKHGWLSSAPGLIVCPTWAGSLASFWALTPASLTGGRPPTEAADGHPPATWEKLARPGSQQLHPSTQEGETAQTSTGGKHAVCTQRRVLPMRRNRA